MGTMDLSHLLAAEWRPALGCTEPAAIAFTAASAANLVEGDIRRVHLVCDPRMYKNCYAVGIPNSGRRTGILWALAIGAALGDPSGKLECFRSLGAPVLRGAADLIARGALTVEVERARRELYVACTVERASGVGRAVVEGDHTRIVSLERNGESLPLDVEPGADETAVARGWAASLSFAQAVEAARDATAADRAALGRGAEFNLAIAEHGLSLLPDAFLRPLETDALTRIGRLVAAGVYARMSGEDMLVMSLAGSGNKGITAAVPVVLWGRHLGAAQERIDEALALACIVTSGVTNRLGSLSAMCGAAIAAGIGVAAALVLLEGGSPDEASAAATNIVGNLAGMICDGAKIGCALKTMTGVDAAFRAASLARAGLVIPVTDGIVGADGRASLDHLGQLAAEGMAAMEDQILAIMQAKLAALRPPSA
jgi:L-cysteine desulfidase